MLFKKMFVGFVVCFAVQIGAVSHNITIRGGYNGCQWADYNGEAKSFGGGYTFSPIKGIGLGITADYELLGFEGPGSLDCSNLNLGLIGKIGHPAYLGIGNGIKLLNPINVDTNYLIWDWKVFTGIEWRVSPSFGLLAEVAYCSSPDLQDFACSEGKIGIVWHFGIPKPEAKPVVVEKQLEPKPVKPPEPEITDLFPPSILILSPAPDIEISQGKIKISGVVSDDGKISRVLVNGKLVERSRGITVTPKVEFKVKDTYSFELLDFPLVPGANYITISAWDEAGHISKKEIVVKRVIEVAEVPVTVKSELAKVTLWTLIVGISDYKDETIPDLKYPHIDAKALYDFILSQKQKGIFRDMRVKYLINDDATMAEITEALGYFLGKAAKQDVVILFFAGHGVAEQGIHYFLAHDTKKSNLFGTGLSEDFIRKGLERIKAEKVILIADACYSGGIIGGSLAFRDVPGQAENFYNKLSESRGRIAISSSSPGETSAELGKLGHGVFTYYLLKGLEGGADDDGDEVITLDEVYDYLYRRVAEDTGGRQHPELYGSKRGDIPLAVK